MRSFYAIGSAQAAEHRQRWRSFGEKPSSPLGLCWQTRKRAPRERHGHNRDLSGCNSIHYLPSFGMSLRLARVSGKQHGSALGGSRRCRGTWIGGSPRRCGLLWVEHPAKIRAFDLLCGLSDRNSLGDRQRLVKPVLGSEKAENRLIQPRSNGAGWQACRR